MRQQLKLPADLGGNLWHYRHHGRANAMHHHAELEFNLITQGAGLYLLANRKYQIRRGDLLWLFPAQEHVLIEQTPDFEMWIGVFKPKAVGCSGINCQRVSTGIREHHTVSINRQSVW
jgi:AraC-like ligand binding domain.